MHRTISILTGALLALAGAVLSGPAAAATGTPAEQCGRSCLLHVLTEYTEAITDNSLARLNLAPNIRATSNGVVVALGKGDVWGKVKRIAYRRAFVDPETGSAVFYGTLTNGPTRDPERWWFYVVRLKVDRGAISEVEEISYDGMLDGTPATVLQMPDRIWDTVLPQDERVDRAGLFKLADSYFSAVAHETDYRDVPWHPECQRRELGVFTVNSQLQPGSCAGEFKNAQVKWPVVNRRFYIADVERGVVVALGDFMAPPDFPKNNASTVMEVFKIEDGMIRYIEAFYRANGQAKAGWGKAP